MVTSSMTLLTSFTSAIQWYQHQVYRKVPASIEATGAIIRFLPQTIISSKKVS